MWKLIYRLVHLCFGIAIALGVAVLLYLGGHAWGLGLITACVWYLFIQSVDRFFFPFTNLASFWSQMQAGLSATERVFALIDAESVVKQTAKNPAPPLRGPRPPTPGEDRGGRARILALNSAHPLARCSGAPQPGDRPVSISCGCSSSASSWAPSRASSGQAPRASAC